MALCSSVCPFIFGGGEGVILNLPAFSTSCAHCVVFLSKTLDSLSAPFHHMLPVLEPGSLLFLLVSRTTVLTTSSKLFALAAAQGIIRLSNKRGITIQLQLRGPTPNVVRAQTGVLVHFTQVYWHLI